MEGKSIKKGIVTFLYGPVRYLLFQVRLMSDAFELKLIEPERVHVVGAELNHSVNNTTVFNNYIFKLLNQESKIVLMN